MFNGAKPGFGQTSTTPSNAFNNMSNVNSLFGQSTFGKPATPGFGQTPAFGQQNTSLFGAGQTQTSGLFGSTATPSFGQPATTQQSGFGSFGAAVQPTQSLFGAPQQAQQAPLFAQAATPSAFGAAAKPPGFGGFSQPTSSLFGQSGQVNTQPGNTIAGVGGSGFGAFNQSAGGGGLFGQNTSGFGQTQTGTNLGTSIAKFQPSPGTDALLKNGTTTNISTKQYCITAMKEYETKSLEELRMEDYLANRKGAQAGGSLFGMQNNAQPTGGSLFGSPATSQATTGIFGQQQQENKSIFGNSGMNTTSFGQQTGFGAPQQPQQANNLFGKPFAAATPSTNTFTSFGQANTTGGSNLFGQQTQKQPFGQQSTGLFGQQATPATSTFGQTAAPGGFGSSFGQPAQQAPSLFGAPAAGADKPAFGMGSTTNTFGFNTNTNPSGSLFGQKPATTNFGAAPSFGAATSAANTTGFSSFGQPAAGGTLFGNTFNKPAQPAFSGFGTATSQPSMGLGQQGGMFGTAANKPGGLFGNTGGGSSLFSNQTGFGNNSTLGGGLGAPLMGTAQNTGMGMGSQPNNSIHQQIIVATSPYGENPIFKNFKSPNEANEDALKPTNPTAQKAILESAANHFKVSTNKSSNNLRVKPIASMQSSKKSLFGGLEEDDPSVEVSFNTKPSAKRLIIKPKPGSNTSRGSFNRSINEATSGNGSIATQHVDESFNQIIPTTLEQSAAVAGTFDADTSRRVSWLRSNPLIKLKDHGKDNTTPLDNTMKELVSEPMKHKQLSTVLDNNDNSLNETAFLQTSGFERSTEDASGTRSLTEEELNIPPHATGVVLKRNGYYTIPELDLLTKYIKSDGSCIVPYLTIGRYGYGNIYYDEPLDIANVNMDEVVFFRNRQVTVYPDDECKPPVGKALNRKAQITLDQVWPFDKTKNEAIKDKIRLKAMKYEEKLRRVCERHDTQFIEYRPETGSWVFRVNHFSRYGLSDSDDEDADDQSVKNGTDPKKAKLLLEKKKQQLKEKDANQNLSPSSKKASGVTAASTPIIEKDQSGKGNNISAISDAESYYHDQRMHHQQHTPQTHEKQSSRRGQSQRGAEAQSPSAANAMDVGVDPHKLQLMKASFFAIDFDEDSMDMELPPSPDQIVPNFRQSDSTAARNLAKASTLSSLSQFSSWVDSESTSVVTTTVAKTSKAPTYAPVQLTKKQVPPKFILKPKIASIRVPRICLPAERSVVAKMHSKCVADAAFFHGRRFKIGFGQKNTFFVLNTVSSQDDENSGALDWRLLFAGRSVNDTSDIILRQIQMRSVEAIDDFEESIVRHLQIQLKATDKIECGGSGSCPYLKSNPGNAQSTLAEHRLLADRQKGLGATQHYASNVWSMCEALWGDHIIVRDHEPQDHYTVMGRKTLLSDWLEETIRVKQPEKKSNLEYLDLLMSMIYSHKITDACDFCISNGDINLAMLLSQASGGAAVRQLIQNQLLSWEEVEADKYVHRQRLKVLMLVAGVSILPNAINGPVSVFENIDWVESIACCLWYLCTPTASINDVLMEYENAFHSVELDVASPLPPYFTEYRPEQISENQKPIRDLRFHLLKLYSERSYPLEALFNPICHTRDPMDFRLSWMILQILEALGYHHLAAYRESQLHSSFANQLETHGLWEWSIFVLMHIKETNQREIAVQNILYKFIELSKDADSAYMTKERFIVEELGVPERWIYWAKAVRAGAAKDFGQQTEYLLMAKQWNEAHSVIMEYLAPEAVINDNIGYLVGLLERFEDSKLVSNWDNQGQIILDYVEINRKFESFKNLNGTDIEYQWEGLTPQLAELCSRINSFPCPTAKHRLCQSEISQRLALLIRGHLFMQSSDVYACHFIQLTLERLPLPQEYQKTLLSHIDIVATDMVLPTK